MIIYQPISLLEKGAQPIRKVFFFGFFDIADSPCFFLLMDFQYVKICFLLMILFVFEEAYAQSKMSLFS